MTSDIDQARWRQYKIKLELLSDTMVRADETFLTIWRDEYKTLLELACEALEKRDV